MNRALLLSVLLLMSGCAALKDETGQYVTDAVVAHIADEVDHRLSQRGLSISEIRSVTDINGDGHIDANEIRETAKGVASDLITSYAAKMELEHRTEWEQATRNLVTRDEQTGLKGDVQDFWTWLKATFGLLITTVISYLVKQVFSAKSDGRRDTEIARSHARMDMVEKLIHRDLNQDGLIGGAGGEAVES